MKKQLRPKLLQTKILSVSIFYLVLFSPNWLKASTSNPSNSIILEFSMDDLYSSLPGSGSANSDTSKLDIQDTLANVASHLPTMYRYGNSGYEFHSDKYSYTDNCHIATKKWMNDYPTEVNNFLKSVNNFLNNTNLKDLTVTQAGIYYDIKAQWYMVMHAK